MTFIMTTGKNGIPTEFFIYNVSRLIKDLAADENEKDSRVPWLNTAVKVPVSVKEAIDHCHGLGHLEEEHIQIADLNRPLIFIELAPDSFNLIDGHHHLEKARRQGIKELPRLDGLCACGYPLSGK